LRLPAALRRPARGGGADLAAGQGLNRGASLELARQVANLPHDGDTLTRIQVPWRSGRGLGERVPCQTVALSPRPPALTQTACHRPPSPRALSGREALHFP